VAYVRKIKYKRKNGKMSTAYQGVYRGPDGRERTKRFDRQYEAQNWVDVNGADLVRGLWDDPASGKVTFREYAARTKADVSARTLINIDGRLNNHAIPHFGNMQMSAVRPSDVRTFVSKLTGAGKAPATVKAVYLTTSQVFDQAVIDGIIAKTPCLGVSLPRERHHEEMHFLSPEQVNDLADAISDRYRALIYTAAYAGLRAGELAALRVSSLELGELGGTIRVTGAASEVRGELTFGPTKTGRNRTVGIPRFLSAMLAEHIERYPSTAGFVFTARAGGPIRHRNFYRRHFRPAVEEARVRALEAGNDNPVPGALRFHDLRHTCAAILIDNGRHMEEVKDHLGHSSIRVTSDRYGHLFPSRRAEMADALEATFRRTVAADDADEMPTKLVFRSA
jgi:integrase